MDTRHPPAWRHWHCAAQTLDKDATLGARLEQTYRTELEALASAKRLAREAVPANGAVLPVWTVGQFSGYAVVDRHDCTVVLLDVFPCALVTCSAATAIDVAKEVSAFVAA